MFTIGFSYARSLDRNYYYDSFFAYRSLFIMLSSICTFILIYFNIPNKKNKWVSFVSPYSFGVYLVHGVLLNFLMESIFPYVKVNSFIGIPLCVIILSVLSVIVVIGLKKVPILNKYI